MATALKRQILPAVPVTLELQDDDGKPYKLTFQVSYDYNAATALQQKTVTQPAFDVDKDGKRERVDPFPMGMKLTEASVWAHSNEPLFFSTLFWAGIITRHPEYDCDEGLEVIRSYMSENNSEIIIGACWDAYLLGLTPQKRAFMEKLKDDAEKKLRGETVDPTSPAANPSTPEKHSTGETSTPLPESTSASA
jgi:hypothetical protein